MTGDVAAVESWRHRVSFTPGSIAGVLVARKRHRCDGHMASERHWIEPGQRYVANALPPDHPEIGNVGWWHLRLCMDCCPEKYADPLTTARALADTDAIAAGSDATAARTGRAGGD